MSKNMNMRNRACSSGKKRKQEKKRKRPGAQDGSPPTPATQGLAGKRAVTAQPGGDEQRADAREAHAPPINRRRESAYVTAQRWLSRRL